jgi:Prokaryotic membrane lipoprotein lipid attachment site
MVIKKLFILIGMILVLSGCQTLRVSRTLDNPENRILKIDDSVNFSNEAEIQLRSNLVLSLNRCWSFSDRNMVFCKSQDSKTNFTALYSVAIEKKW